MADDTAGTILPEQLTSMRALNDICLRVLEDMRRAQVHLVEKAKESDVAGAARCFIAVRDIGDALDEAMTELHKLRQALQITIIPEKFQQQGVTSFTVDDARVTISARLSVTVLDKEKSMGWLRENGLDDIIQETVNASTLQATIKKMIEDEGREPPDDIFKLSPVMNTSVTKVKRKAGVV